MITVYCQNVWNHNPSEYRNTLIRSLVSDFDADICLFQECGPETNRVGGAPLPKLMQDEYTEVCSEVADRNFTPVFYKTEKFNLIDSGYVLYRGLNDVNSKSITWAVLEDKASLTKFAVASTHFWWMSESENDNKQRLENVDQLGEVCDLIIKKHGVGVIIGGDLNNGKNADQGDEPYRYMLSKQFEDVRINAAQTTDEYTHHDYPVLKEDGTYANGPMPVRNLDHIFTYGNCPFKAEKFDVLTSTKALDSSDHCPLVAQFK